MHEFAGEREREKKKTAVAWVCRVKEQN
jgi:hypothetical protein